jgi:hypothetical protein
MTQFLQSRPWTDIDATTDAPAPSIKKPINLQHSELKMPVYLLTNDDLKVTLENFPDKDGVLTTTRCPPFTATRPMAIERVTKFEILDEFGYDCGVGVLFGEVKK